MADYWRRATAVPGTAYSGIYGSAMNVVYPTDSSGQPYVNTSQTYPPLETSLHGNSAHYAPSPPGVRERSREQVMYDYDDARKTYLGILQRERAELDQTKHEVDALSHEKFKLRQDLSDAEARAAAAARDRDIANAKLVQETAALRADNARLQTEVATLSNQLKKSHEERTTALIAQGQLEALVSTLKAETLASGRTIGDLNATIRALSGEMSRRDPYHTIKEMRERSEPSSTQGFQVTIATLEDQTRNLQAKLTEALKERDAAVASKSADAATDKLRRDLQTVSDELSRAVSERDKIIAVAKQATMEHDQLVAKFSELQKQADSDRALRIDLGNQLEALRKGAPVVKEDPSKTKAAAPTAALAEDERKVYEDAAREQKLAMDSLRAALNDLQLTTRAAFSALDKVERGADLGDLKTAKLITVNIALESLTGLLERTPKQPGAQEPYVKVFNTLGEKVCEATPTSGDKPVFDVAKDVAALRFLRGSTAEARIEVWTKVPGSEAAFLGCVYLKDSTLLDSLADGSKRSIPLPLVARNAEKDPLISGAKSLGFITFSASCVVAGRAPAPAPAAPAITKQSSEVVKPKPEAKPEEPKPKPAEDAKPKPVEEPKPATESAARQPKVIKPTAVVMYITSGEKLLKRDNLTESDPYVVIMHNGKELFRTSAMSNEPNPRWPRNENSTTTVSVDPADPEPYYFDVWDDNSPLPTDYFIGRATMTASEILSGTGVRSMELAPRKDEPDQSVKDNAGKLGRISIDITVLQGEAAGTQEKKPAAAPVGAGNAMQVPTETPSKEEIAAVSTGVARKIIVQVIGCDNLLEHGGMFGNTDPYVEVRDPNGVDLFTTPIVPKSRNPKWDASVAMKETVIAPSDAAFVTFDVLDDEKVAGLVGPKPRYLGFAKISCNRILASLDKPLVLALGPRDNESEDHIKNAAKGTLGTITVHFTRVYNAPGGTASGTGATASTGAPNSAAKAGGDAAAAAAVNVDEIRQATLSVCAVNGVLSRNKGLWEKGSDVFGVIKLPDGRKKELPVIQDTQNAKWDDPLENSINMQVVPGGTQKVVIEFWCAGVSNRFLGQAVLTHAQIYNLNGQTGTFDLEPQDGMNDSEVTENKGKLGKVTVKSVVTGIPTKRATTMLLESIASRVAAPTQPFLALIHVQKATGLMNRQVNGEISDPFVQIVGPNGETHPTQPRENELNPVWDVVDGSVKMKIDPNDATGCITFNVCDVGTSSGKKAMGSATLMISDLIREGLGIRTFKLEKGFKEVDSDIIANSGKLGTLTVSIQVAEDLKAQQSTERIVPSGVLSANEEPYLIQVVSGVGLFKRAKLPSAICEVKIGGKVILTTQPGGETQQPLWGKDAANSSKIVNLAPADQSDILFYLFDVADGNRASLGAAKLPIVTACASESHTLKVIRLPTETDPKIMQSDGNLGEITVNVIKQKQPQGPTSAAGAPPPVAVGGGAAVQQPAAAPPAAPPKKLNVKLMLKSGKDLIVKDTFTSDPLVRIYKGETLRYESDTVTSTLNPEWKNANVMLELLPGDPEPVRFLVYDRDKHMFGADTFEDMGVGSIAVDKILTFLGKPCQVDLQHEGKPAGSLTLEFAVVPS